MKKIVVVVGPTASGKTSLSIEIAKKFDGEIVSCDSMQIYKDMQIATAKPTIEERENIPHYMMDFVNVDEEYNLSQYVSDAKKVIDDIISRGKLPIIVGGTGLYVNNLIDNIQLIKLDTDPILREQLNKRIKEVGGEVMLEELAQFDPETAKILHPNDHTRIVRAIEIYKTGNITMSEQKIKSKQHKSDFDPCMIGLNFNDRQKLYDRINLRVDLMLQEGLLDEAKRVLSSKISKTASQAIGYKELKPYFDGIITLDEAIANLKQETRRYAKRQLSWFRRDERIEWFYPDLEENFENLIKKINKKVEIFL